MFSNQPGVSRLIRIIMLTASLMIQFAYSKPQDPSQAVAIGSSMVEMASNNAIFSKKMDFDLPFASGKSDTQIGTGAAMRNDNDDDDDDDESSEEERRKRSIVGEEEALLALPINHHHVHRDKRSPCHYGGGGTTGGGGGGGTDADGDVDINEARRRANARKRKAAAKRRSTSSKKNTNSRRKLVNDEDGDDAEYQVLERRKRQTELNDLNQNITTASNEFAQKAQQFAEQLRNIWQNFTISMNDMAQKLKQHFSGQDSANVTEI